MCAPAGNIQNPFIGMPAMPLRVICYVMSVWKWGWTLSSRFRSPHRAWVSDKEDTRGLGRMPWGFFTFREKTSYSAFSDSPGSPSGYWGSAFIFAAELPLSPTWKTTEAVWTQTVITTWSFQDCPRESKPASPAGHGLRSLIKNVHEKEIFCLCLRQIGTL